MGYATARARADPYRAALCRVTRYVVTQLLAGNRHVIQGLTMYYVLNMSPSDIATSLGVHAGQVKGWLQRVVGASLTAATAARVAPRVLTRIGEVRIPSLTVPDEGGMLRCRACGALMDPSKAASHVINKHKHIVMRYVDAVLPLLGL